MIEGVVNAAYEAVIRLSLRGPSGQAREIDAVIDTGFNGFLTLPPREKDFAAMTQGNRYDARQSL